MPTISFIIGGQCPPYISSIYGELNLPGVLHHLRSLQNFQPDQASIIAEIGNDSRTNLVAFLDRSWRSVMVRESVSGS